MIPNRIDWCEQIAERCWQGEGDGGERSPNVHERYNAMALEMGQLKDDATKPQGGKQIHYHSIDQIEAAVNRLQFKYRLHILPSTLESAVTQVQQTASRKDRDGNVEIFGELNKPISSIRVQVDVINIDNPGDRFAMEWCDDGDDATKAGSFVVKYAYMKLFHVNDGADEEQTDSKVGGRWQNQESTQQSQPSTQSKSATTTAPPAQTEVKSVAVDQIPPNEKQTPSNGVVAAAPEVSDPATREEKIAALNWYSHNIPDAEIDKAKWASNRITMELALFEKRKRDGKLSDREKQVGDSFRYVFAAIKRLHTKPSNCGEDCQHWQPVAAVFKTGGKILDKVGTGTF